MTGDSSAVQGAPIDEQTDDEFIGERVYQVMWRKKHSQTEVAKHLGITQSALSHKLRGHRPFFARELGTVAAMLNVNPEYFLGFTDDPRPVMSDEGREKSPLSGLNRRPFAYKVSTLDVLGRVLPFERPA